MVTGVVLDSSVWIPLLRGSRSYNAYVHELESAHRLYMLAPIAMELRAGAQRAKLGALEHLFAVLPSVPVVERIDYLRAGELYALCREQGMGVRSLLDCLIAAIVERHPGLRVVHNDRDFEWLATVSPLNQERIEVER